MSSETGSGLIKFDHEVYLRVQSGQGPPKRTLPSQNLSGERLLVALELPGKALFKIIF